MDAGRGARPEYNGVLQVDPEEIRQRFEQLSDEGLMSIDRLDLIELAQQYYDAEVSRRGLKTTPAAAVEESAEEQLVLFSTFETLEEANLVRALLESAEIPVKLDNELSSQRTGAGGLRLMVPASSLQQAEEILQAQISEEDLAAQAEAADPIEPVPDED